MSEIRDEDQTMGNGYFEPGMSGVVDRLTSGGYEDTWKGEARGIRALQSGHVHTPDELLIESSDRFEGFSDPDDQAMVMAVRCPSDGCSGTYTVPYGKDMSVIDGDWIA